MTSSLAAVGRVRLRPQLLTLFLVVSSTTLACTLQPPAPDHSGPIVVTRSTPAPLEQGVPRNGLVRLWFSAPLDPFSVDDRSIDVVSAEVRQSGEIRYDPIEQSLIWTPRGWLRSELAYDAVTDESLRGLRSNEPVELSTVTFHTSSDTIELPEPPPPSFDDELLPLLQQSCGFSSCHGAPSPAIGLDLSSAEGVRSSAIGVAAEGWQGYRRIDPRSAARSYLVYKITDESSVRGDRMPPGAPLTPAQLELIVRWIDGGGES